MSQKPRKKSDSLLRLDMSFDEALKRVAQTDPKELADAFAETERENEEAKKYVEERRESIRKGARRAPKRFRL
jgi:hypothetical protein